MDLAQPLSDEEFDELADFLTSDAALEEAMDISMLDGFLTALLIGPNMIPPSRWLPEVWGETPGQAMNWASDKQAGHMTQLVLRHMNDIHWQLTNDRDNYQPLVYEHEAEGKVVPVIDEWCTGFMRGTELDNMGWDALFEADDGNDLLMPIMLYGTEEGWQQMEDDPRLAERHDEFADALADCVLSIQDYWMPARKAKSTIRHAEAPPGRNDPCPCGSGKKFKKCCGAAGSLH